MRVTLEEASELRGVEVQLQGVGSVQWSERTRDAQAESSVPVVAQELYLSETQNILGTFPGTLMLLAQAMLVLTCASTLWCSMHDPEPRVLY